MLTDFSPIESSTVDYKLMLETKKPISWLKSVSAFANTDGGSIIFGIADDTHAPVGLDDLQSNASKITEFIKARIFPAPRFSLNPSLVEGKDILILQVQNGPNYPYYYVADGIREAYIRHGDQSVKASIQELNQLVLRGENKTFDSLPSAYSEKDVSFTLIAATYKQEIGEDFHLSRDPISMQFVTPEGQVTNAGLLLCDQGPLRQSRIFCTRWKGMEKGAIDDDALDDQEYSGCSIITLLQNAETFIRNNSKNPWTIRGMTREERSDYPRRAVREVLVNAIIHRDYQIIGSEIHIDIFDDRLEIMSPGGMMSGKRIQDMDLHHIPSMRRNQIISDLFGRLHYMDRRGSGIQRILRSYDEVNEKPTFYSDTDCFIAVLPNRSVAENAQLQFDVPSIQPEKTQLRIVEKQLRDKETQLTVVQTDATAFANMVLERIPSMRKKTLLRLQDMFRTYGYQYSFNRANMATSLSVQENRASVLIKQLVDAGIVERHKRGEYAFKLH